MFEKSKMNEIIFFAQNIYELRIIVLTLNKNMV